MGSLSQSSPTLRRSLLGVLATGVLALCFGGASAHAVKPYTNQVYKQPKAPLKEGKNIKLLQKKEHRLPLAKSNALTRSGSAPQFKRSQWAWGILNRR
jgi:hypothetical protein